MIKERIWLVRDLEGLPGDIPLALTREQLEIQIAVWPGVNAGISVALRKKADVIRHMQPGDAPVQCERYELSVILPAYSS